MPVMGTNAFRLHEHMLYKPEVKKLLSVGQEIPGCAVIENRSRSLNKGGSNKC